MRTAVLNGRDQSLRALHPDLDVRLYGTPEGWDVAADGGVSRAGVAMAPRGQLALPGEHNALNLCGALTALEALGVSLTSLPAALRASIRSRIAWRRSRSAMGSPG